MDELFEKIQKMIVEKLDIDPAKVTLDASFRNDLGADSLDTYELVYAIEEELGVSIPDEKANEFETVRDAYDFIKAHSDGDKIELLNIDTHHDMTPENKSLDCGNWILKLAQENLLDNPALGWIHNPISFEMYGINGKGKDKFSKLLRRLDKGTSLDGIANEQYDLIFLARSDTWSPPHLDKYFCLLADIIKEHFTDIIVESGITNPRTAYLQYAVTMQEQLASIRKERELA